MVAVMKSPFSMFLTWTPSISGGTLSLFIKAMSKPLNVSFGLVFVEPFDTRCGVALFLKRIVWFAQVCPWSFASAVAQGAFAIDKGLVGWSSEHVVVDHVLMTGDAALWIGLVAKGGTGKNQQGSRNQQDAQIWFRVCFHVVSPLIDVGLDQRRLFCPYIDIEQQVCQGESVNW